MQVYRIDKHHRLNYNKYILFMNYTHIWYNHSYLYGSYNEYISSYYHIPVIKYKSYYFNLF